MIGWVAGAFVLFMIAVVWSTWYETPPYEEWD